MFSKILEIPTFLDTNSSGTMIMIDEVMLGFSMKRNFLVKGKKGALRGRHAHKLLSQVIVCISGKCKLFLTDGIEKKHLILSSKSKAVLIPPMIWAEQTYLQDDTIISVFCDRYYEENDYIHNFNEYLSLNRN
jgi:dTDP-4-dehydrorhamnose 3,5-epimerase-like enzyme